MAVACCYFTMHDAGAWSLFFETKGYKTIRCVTYVPLLYTTMDRKAQQELTEESEEGLNMLQEVALLRGA